VVGKMHACARAKVIEIWVDLDFIVGTKTANGIDVLATVLDLFAFRIYCLIYAVVR
jgi:hypothetical protein